MREDITDAYLWGMSDCLHGIEFGHGLTLTLQELPDVPKEVVEYYYRMGWEDEKADPGLYRHLQTNETDLLKELGWT